jgi:hypothetical protein
MNLLYSTALWLALVSAIIFVHECGHYWAARWAGVSRENVRIRMLHLPQHIALRNVDGSWVSPWQQPVYGQLCAQYFHGNRSKIILYVGAGLIVGSIFVMLGTWTLFEAGFPRTAFNLVFLSAQIHGLYFLAEAVIYLRLRRPFGDFTGLWLLSKSAFCVVCLSVVILHALAFLVFYI